MKVSKEISFRKMAVPQKPAPKRIANEALQIVGEKSVEGSKSPFKYENKAGANVK
jgi:hypothetical protein